MRIRLGFVKAVIIILLCIAVFGTAGYFCYMLFVSPVQMARKEQARPRPTLPPDPSIAEFEKCLNLKNSGDLPGAREAFVAFVEQNPSSPKIEEAKDLLGEINTDIFLSTAPSPDKQQYIIQKGDTLTAIERKTRATGELIMRTNNLEDLTRLQIGQVLIIAHPDFSLYINRKLQTVTLLNKGRFFKRYRVRDWKAHVPKSPAPISTKITEKIAWKNGQRVTFGHKDYAGSSRWITLGTAGYTLYTDEPEQDAPKPQGGLGLTAEDMEELSTLLNKNTPVIIQ